MYDLILQLAIMFSLGAIVYLFAVAVPRIGEPETKPNIIREWFRRLPLHHIDEAINQSKDKILRRTKILVMKADNFISLHLNKDKDKPTLNP